MQGFKLALSIILFFQQMITLKIILKQRCDDVTHRQLRIRAYSNKAYKVLETLKEDYSFQ